MIFEKVRPATPKYRRLAAEWDKQNYEFLECGFKNEEIAQRLADLNRDMTAYERRFLDKVNGSVVQSDFPNGGIRVGCVKSFRDHAAAVQDLFAIEVDRPRLDDDEREQLRQSTEVLALPHNLISRRTTRDGMVATALDLLPTPMVPAQS